MRSFLPSSLFLKKACLFMALFYCGMLWAQQRIKGQVLDALDNTPLMGVSVYFDGTSIGTITDESGIFELPLAQKINAALVVSYLGYETRSIADLQNLSKGFTAKIYLEEEAVALDEVVLEPDTWSRERKYRLFKRAFLGEDTAAQRTKILNPEVLRFYYNKQTVYTLRLCLCSFKNSKQTPGLSNALCPDRF
jgi:hypothetical protein